ncbi:hypothetical protein AYM40_04805 [Paraburkholderia phytofirmans OLGA172]|uniref:Uncharacterized protein n=1 Tax=Paraburkholderia phytofirmans OLGA172 TaxID=1417228 RepID=A0A160FIQ8_9BURK|nr:hypothetical protein AYM40_04805 [Paraburkholderia phytofirmans OLGA172]
MQWMWPSTVVLRFFIRNRYPLGEPLVVRLMQMPRSRHASSASSRKRTGSAFSNSREIAAREGAGGSGRGADSEKQAQEIWRDKEDD